MVYMTWYRGNSMTYKLDSWRESMALPSPTPSYPLSPLQGCYTDHDRWPRDYIKWLVVNNHPPHWYKNLTLSEKNNRYWNKRWGPRRGEFREFRHGPCSIPGTLTVDNNKNDDNNKKPSRPDTLVVSWILVVEAGTYLITNAESRRRRSDSRNPVR